MENSIQNVSSLTEVEDFVHSPLDEWTKAIDEFRASYLVLNKSDQRLMQIKQSSTYFGLCLESQPNQLLASMCQELVSLTQEIDEPFNYALLQVHTSRLQRLTQRANQLIGVMSSRFTSNAEALGL